jgi:hypothetical protein
MEKHIISCSCTSDEHSVVFKFDEEDLYVVTFLQTGTFWDRIVIGIKYILGFKSRYGEFSETILNKKEAEKLKKLIDQYLLTT